MNIGVSISKADEMRYRMSQAFFFKNRDDSNNENVLPAGFAPHSLLGFLHTPPRTHRISGLKSQVLKPTFLA